ncbi:hypothetical protein CRUP_028808 [Coryphaenoides rupestris]|nr:hypothetical protein CRUP_028808 [Coryphaenoides rupestris]
MKTHPESFHGMSQTSIRRREGWRREGQGRSQERPRDLSPRAPDRQGRGAERSRERSHTHSSHMERHEEDSYRDRSPISSQHRRDVEGHVHPGYEKEEAFRDRPKDGSGKALGDVRGLKSLVVEHGHGITNNQGPPRNTKSLTVKSSPMWGVKSSPVRAAKSSPVKAAKSSPVRAAKSSPVRAAKISPVKAAKSFPVRAAKSFPVRAVKIPPGTDIKSSPRMDVKCSPARAVKSSPARAVKSSPGTDVKSSPARAIKSSLVRAVKSSTGADVKSSQGRDGNGNTPPWTAKSLPRDTKDRHTVNKRLEHRSKNQQESSEVTVVSEETLTIKVDMNRPVSKNSALCYSTDRQLSLDLVNVGRQRLDFLPMMEHSGTYRENTVHSGTFAQEVITLVHQVKEQYFRGNTVTLNERFSASKDGGLEDKPAAEDQQPTLNSNVMIGHQPLLEPLEPMRDPDDLRNNLERRRQERTEGVKITIAGGSQSHRAPGAGSEPAAMFGEYGEEGREFHNPQGPRNLRFQRRGGAPQGRNAGRFGNRLGPRPQ